MDNLELFPFPHKSGNKWDLIKKGDESHTPVKKVIVTTSVVKYLPTKFNKITIALAEKDTELFKTFQDLFTTDLETQPFLKNNELSLKLTEQMKEQTKAFKIGSIIKCAIQFNGVWKVAGKHHVSWSLVQVKEEPQEPINYF